MQNVRAGLRSQGARGAADSLMEGGTPPKNLQGNENMGLGSSMAVVRQGVEGVVAPDAGGGSADYDDAADGGGDSADDDDAEEGEPLAARAHRAGEAKKQARRAAAGVPVVQKKPEEFTDEDFLTTNRSLFEEATLGTSSCVRRFGANDLVMQGAAKELGKHCEEHWSHGNLKTTRGRSLVGFSGFSYVGGDLDEAAQKEDTAMIRTELLRPAKADLPGLETIEKRVFEYAKTHPEANGRKATTIGIDLLRCRGPESAGTSTFSSHLDTWSFKKSSRSRLPVLTFVVSLGPTPVPMMQVLGAASAFDYGMTVGTTERSHVHALAHTRMTACIPTHGAH